MITHEQSISAKFLDKDEWQLSPSSFRCCVGTCDHFASHYNAQLFKFNSTFASPGTEAVDAFYQYQSKDNDWKCPRTGIIVKAVRYIKHCYASGTLIVLHWPSGLF